MLIWQYLLHAHREGGLKPVHVSWYNAFASHTGEGLAQAREMISKYASLPKSTLRGGSSVTLLERSGVVDHFFRTCMARYQLLALADYDTSRENMKKEYEIFFTEALKVMNSRSEELSQPWAELFTKDLIRQ